MTGPSAPRLPASRRRVLAAGLGAAALAAVPGTARAAAPAAAAAGKGAPVEYHAWASPAAFHSGEAHGTRFTGGRRPGVVIGTAAGTVDYTDPHTKTTKKWDYAQWTTPLHAVGFGATEAVSSWNADTPAGTWLQVELEGTYSTGAKTPWYVMGRWASGDGDIKRTSVDGQKDGTSAVYTDTFSMDDNSAGAPKLVAYRLRVTLYRTPGTSLTPTLWRVGAFASAIPDRTSVPISKPGLPGGRELQVPRYSQDIHSGQYPEYDGGGEAWCSPTSSEMNIESWGRKPTAADLAWVDRSYADPQVCNAARRTYDYQYEGCGNWPFNAAYAASYRDMQGVITRLRSLNDVETLVGAGIPVITSQSFLASELDGAGYGTSGHLMCLVGFTADGDVIANDPASKDDAAVRHVYRRAQFETVWQRTKRKLADGSTGSGTGGVAYVYWPLEASRTQREALARVGIS